MASRPDPIDRIARLVLLGAGVLLVVVGIVLLALVGVIGAYAAVAAIPLVLGVLLLLCAALLQRLQQVDVEAGGARIGIKLTQKALQLARSIVYFLR